MVLCPGALRHWWEYQPRRKDRPTRTVPRCLLLLHCSASDAGSDWFTGDPCPHGLADQREPDPIAFGPTQRRAHSHADRIANLDRPNHPPIHVAHHISADRNAVQGPDVIKPVVRTVAVADHLESHNIAICSAHQCPPVGIALAVANHVGADHSANGHTDQQ